jgi:hypothetical protein
VTGPTVDKSAVHHNGIPALEAGLQSGRASGQQCVDPFARFASNTSAITRRVPGAFASRLAHERDTWSCRAMAATVMPGEEGRG